MTHDTRPESGGIIVRASRPDGGFTIITNDTARDTNLSFRALGLLTHMLSHTDGWHISAADLARGEGREGRDAIRTALKELEDAGYVRRSKRQDTRGRWITETTVYDTPHSEETRAPVKKPRTPKPATAPTAQHTPEVEEISALTEVMAAWSDAARGKTAQAPAAVSRVVGDALNAGADPAAVSRAVLAIVGDGEPVVAWRLTRYLNGKTDTHPRDPRFGPKAIHYAADMPSDPSEYSEDL